MTIQASVPFSRLGVATGNLTFFRQVGASVGLALVEMGQAAVLGEGSFPVQSGQGSLVSQATGLDVAVSADEATKVVIAYEPVWAIGTGKTAKAEDAEEG